MNTSHKDYIEYLKISEDWPLDDWSITKECFDKIIEILPFGKVILEIGSGHSTRLLSQFYTMISIESSIDWMNKYKSFYHYIPLKPMTSTYFGETVWLDIDTLTYVLKDMTYDLLLVDAGGDRVGIIDNISLFKSDIPIIFDDTMNTDYLRCATLVSEQLNKSCTTYQCAVNKYVVVWFDGKKFTLVN